MKVKKCVWVLVIAFIVCSFVMQACEPWPFYRGKNKDLYSIALHSALGATGYQQDKISVLEEDEYGRKLFIVGFRYVHGILGVFISQKTDDQYAYYYEDVNFLIKDKCVSSYDKDEIYKYFTFEAVEALKERNDWGKEVGSRECFKVPITGGKQYLKEKLSNKTIKKAGKQVFYNTIYEMPLCEDSYGHIIWYMEGLVNKGDDHHRYYVFFFNTDGTLKGDDAIMEIEDIWNYSEQMIAFKEVNHWNKEA